jgi:hypothetical protein
MPLKNKIETVYGKLTTEVLDNITKDGWIPWSIHTDKPVESPHTVTDIYFYRLEA